MGKLVIDLNQFKVIKKHDIDKDAPYLWVMGIVVDLNTLLSKEFIIKKNPKYGNLGDKFKKGESRAISDDLGRIERTVRPIGTLLTAGVITVAWERATTRDETRQKAYNDAADVVQDFIAGRVASFNTAPPTAAEMAKVQADIEAVIRKDFKADWSIFHPLVDHFIGSAQCQQALDGTKSFNQDLHFDYDTGGTHYQVTGVFTYTP